jgi:hypothetical protein
MPEISIKAMKQLFFVAVPICLIRVSIGNTLDSLNRFTRNKSRITVLVSFILHYKSH